MRDRIHACRCRGTARRAPTKTTPSVPSGQRPRAFGKIGAAAKASLSEGGGFDAVGGRWGDVEKLQVLYRAWLR